LDARFLLYAQSHIGIDRGVGIDYQVAERPNYKRIAVADITKGLPVMTGQFDHVVMLAVLEHLASPEVTLAETCRVLRSGGALILTWPNTAVDPVLNVLCRLGLVSDAMESGHHQKRIPARDLTRMLTRIGYEHCRHERFELGLNDLMVAHKERSC
jgi:2-polyprenyl-3-methyl-5-hydroxy-6-metoxy-1,4-benzoquinol methylase